MACSWCYCAWWMFCEVLAVDILNFYNFILVILRIECIDFDMKLFSVNASSFMNLRWWWDSLKKILQQFLKSFSGKDFILVILINPQNLLVHWNELTVKMGYFQNTSSLVCLNIMLIIIIIVKGKINIVTRAQWTAWIQYSKINDMSLLEQLLVANVKNEL